MDNPLRNIPLVLTPNKVFKEVNGDSGLTKKRKLSMSSDSSDSNSTVEKNLLNDQFSELTLEFRPKAKSDDNGMIKLEEPQSFSGLAIPKPMRLGKPIEEQTKINISPPKDQLMGDIIKMTQSDIGGISKYLNLNLNEKLETWDKMVQGPNKGPNQGPNKGPLEKNTLNTSQIFTQFFKSTMNIPFLSPEILNATKKYASSGSDSLKSSQTKSHYIGTLTRDERAEKIEKYLEKKKSRKWKHIRYTIRKDLADKRERQQGRFVKTPKLLSHSEIYIRAKQQEIEESNKIKSPLKVSKVKDDFSAGLISLGKRADKIDLLEDTSIPNNINVESNISMSDPNFNR